MTTYDEQFLIEIGYRYPGGVDEVRIPARLVILSESFHCTQCRETLWYGTLGSSVMLIQDLHFFNQYGRLGRHTAKRCYEYRMAQAAVQEYNDYARDHGLPEVS